MANGEYDVSYAPEVDNSVGVPVVNNCLIGPCFDSEGKMRGIVQLINKKHGTPISFQDEREFMNLLPAVAEMIKQADEVKYVSDVSANMLVSLATSRDQILNSAKIYEERDISTVHAALLQVVNRVDNFSKHKQKHTMRDYISTQ